VIHANQWQLSAQRQSLGSIHPNHQRSCQAGSPGNGNGVDIRQAKVGLLQGFIDHRVNGADMLARCDFRKYTAIFGVQVDLSGDHIGKYLSSVLNHRCGGFITAGLNTQ